MVSSVKLWHQIDTGIQKIDIMQSEKHLLQLVGKRGTVMTMTVECMEGEIAMTVHSSAQLNLVERGPNL